MNPGEISVEIIDDLNYKAMAGFGRELCERRKRR